MFTGSSKWTKQREAKSTNRKQNQKAGPVKFIEATVEALKVTQKIKNGMLKVFHTRWKTVSYEVQKEITNDFISEHVKDEYLKYLTTPGTTRSESITTLSPTERLQLIFELIQTDSRLFAEFKYATAGEIFFCLQDIDSVEEINKLKPEKKTELLLR